VNIDAVMMAHFNLIVQGERERKMYMKKEKLIQIKFIPFFNIEDLIKRLTLFGLFNLSIEDLVANR